MQTMTQGEKVMLRYQYILSNLGFVMGDFAYTADTFANRWRVLQQQMTQFGATVGTIFINAFKPVLRVLNRVMDAAIQFAETVLNALGAIFGWTYEISAAGISDDLGLGEMADDMGDIASGAGDTASGLGDAAKNAAKLKTQLQSFDKLNNLTSPGGSGSGGSGGSGGGGGGGGGGGTAGGSGAISIARHTGEGIIKAYESTIDSLFGLGEYISTSLRDVLRNIDWESVYAGARSFGTGLASFLNGLIRPDTFYEVGKTIANSLNTAMEFFFGLGDVFSFKNLGVSIRNALMGFFQNFNWDLAKANIGVWLEGLAETINNLITPELFSEIGTFLSNAVNTAFHGMKKFFIKLDGKNIGVSLAEGANSFIDGLDADEIADAINHALEDVVGAVVSFAENLHWEDAWAKAKEVLSKLDIPAPELILGTFAITLAAKIALGAGKLLLAGEALKWLFGGAAASAAMAESTAAAGTAAGAVGTGGILSIAIPVIGTLIIGKALEIVFPEKDTAGAAVEAELRSALYYDPNDPGNASWNVPVVPEVDQDIWDAKFDLIKAIKDKWKEWFSKDPIKIEGEVEATKMTNKIPLEARVVTDGKVQSSSLDTTGIPAPQKKVTGVEALANDLNTTGLPGDKKKVFGMLAVANNFKDGIANGRKNVNNVTANASSMKDKVKSKALYNVLAYTKELKKQNGFRAFKLTGKLASSNGKYVLQMARSGGVFEDGKRYKIPQFADGGIPFPTHGSMFIAGEAGPEVVGHVGGRTEVLNASQIAVAVSDGVARANNSVVNALAAQNRILVGILEKKTGISSRDIFTAVRAEAANYQLRTGTPAFQ